MHLLDTRMFNMTYTICWEIRKTQQTEKRCHQERQYTSIKNYFNIEGHSFNIHAKFILTEQLNQTNLDKLTPQKRLKIGENL